MAKIAVLSDEESDARKAASDAEFDALWNPTENDPSFTTIFDVQTDSKTNVAPNLVEKYKEFSKKLDTVAEKINQLADLKDVLALNKDESGTKLPSTQLAGLASTLIKNPEGTEKLIDFLTLHPNYAKRMGQLAKDNSGASPDTETLEKIVEFAVTKPNDFREVLPSALNLAEKATALNKRLDGLAPKFTSIPLLQAQLKSQQNFDPATLDSAKIAELSEKLDQVSGTLDVLTNKKYELTAKTADALLNKALSSGKLDIAQDGDNPLAQDLLDKTKLEAFAKEAEPLLKSNPGLADTLIANYDPATASTIGSNIGLSNIQPALKLAGVLSPALKDGKAGNIASALPLVKTLLQNPEGTEKLAALLKAHPEYVTQIGNLAKAAPATQGDSLQKMTEFAVTKPDDFAKILPDALTLGEKTNALNTRLDGLKANFQSIAPLQAQLKSQSNLDFTKLDSAKIKELSGKVDQVSGVLDVLSDPQYSRTAKIFDGMLTKSLDGGKMDITKAEENPILKEFLDKTKLEAFAKESELFLTDQPDLGEFLVNNYDPSKPTGPKATANFTLLFNNPEELKVLNTSIKTNKDMKSLLTGTFDFAKLTDPKKFTDDNRTILSQLDDPLTEQLFKNSSLADNPIIANVMFDKSKRALATAFGYQDPIERKDKQGHPIPADNPLVAIINAIATLLFGAEMGGQIATSLAKMMTGQSQGQGV